MPPPPDANAIRVLLLATDPAVLDAAVAALQDGEECHYRITVSSDCDAARDALAAGRHDVCLLASRVGERDGLGWLRAAAGRGCDTPVICLLDPAERGLAAEALAAGARDSLIVSEMTPPVLQRAIRYAVELARQRESLIRSEQRFASAALITSDGLWEWDLRRDRISFSPRWKSLLGFAGDEVADDPEEWFRRVHPDDQPELKRDLASLIEGASRQMTNEHRLQHKSGAYRWMSCSALATAASSGEVEAVTGALTDITERKQAEDRLRQSALRDELTGLPNRAVFLDRVDRAIERAKRHGEALFAVLCLDLDRFKNINDSLGHLAGDQLLVSVARRLERCVRNADSVARLGGDEYAILLEEIRDISDALRVAERIRADLAHPFRIGNEEAFVSASIGIALSASGYGRGEHLLRDADTAVHRAKLQGRDGHVIFDPQMHQQASNRLRLESDLRKALDRGEFVAHYQPIVALADGRVAGFEALVRWRQAERGLVSPGDFIPLAEETGIIVFIDRWVLLEACRQMTEWHAQFPRTPPLSISINLSTKQFTRPDVLDTVRRVLRDTGLSPQCVRYEITESVIMQNIERVNDTLQDLRGLRVQLHIDDFGTGYSSLSYLSRLRIDSLKIDHSFVRAMAPSGEDYEIVRTIINLAHNLGMDVVAEGVETAEHTRLLRDLGCEYAQGYFFSRPLEASAAEDLLRRNPSW